MSTTAGDRTQRIHLQDRSYYAGGSIKLMAASGIFVEGGVGVIIDRKSSLQFREGFDYLEADAFLSSYKFDNVLTSTNEGIIGFIDNPFVDFGIGTILQGYSSPCQIRLYGKLFPLNYELVGTDQFNDVRVVESGGSQKFDFQKRQQFSVGVEFAFILGRFSRR